MLVIIYRKIVQGMKKDYQGNLDKISSHISVTERDKEIERECFSDYIKWLSFFPFKYLNLT